MLRHTFATSMLNAGMSLPSLQQILGHKTIIMTLIYAKLSHGKIKDEYATAMEIIKTQRGFPDVTEETSIEIQILRLSALIKSKITNQRKRLQILKAVSRVKSLIGNSSP